jgi:serine/threonine protein kinase
MEGLLELDRIGKLIAGKYRLELVLGRGGMGTVYRATHTWTGRAVAVKYLHPDHAQDAGSVSRFLREARTAASVRHPNAVDVLDMGQDTDGSAYLVLELLEGSTLAEHFAASKTMDPAALARVLVPVLEALEELHRVGVVHRDFKPANIFLARTSRGHLLPKLLDFGVAKVLDESAGLSTTTGIVVGTPAYMAPEQAAGMGDVGPWTDLWAVGAVLYQGLVGELPFAAPTPSLMLVNVMTKAVAPLASKRPDLNAALCAVVDRALTKDAKERFQTAADMAQALCDATGIQLGSQSVPLPELTRSGVVATTPSTPSETIQVSGTSLTPPSLVAFDAPTVAATPSRQQAVSVPPPLPSTPPPSGPGASARADLEKHPEKKHWTGPSATGRLHAPRLRQRRLLWSALGLVALGLAGHRFLGEGAEQAPAGAVTAPPAELASPRAPEPDDTAPPSAPSAATAVGGGSGVGVIAPSEPQKPALAAQPGPDAGLVAGPLDAPAAPAGSTPPALGTESPAGGGRASEGAGSAARARSARRAAEARASAREKTSGDTSAGAPAALSPAAKPSAGSPVPTAPAGARQADGPSPPRVVREW